MTIIKLHKILGEKIKQGHGRKRVCVDKSSFKHPLEEDGALILDVNNVEIDHVRIFDGDGFIACRKDGTERFNQVLIIRGDS